MSFLLSLRPWNAFEVHSFRSADGILMTEHPFAAEAIAEILRGFYFTKRDILIGGGRLTEIGDRIEHALHQLGFVEKAFQFPICYGGQSLTASTHKIDGYHDRVAVECEWNNKDTFFDRDLSNFRLLYNCGIIDVGIIITRSSSLSPIFKRMVLEDGLSGSKFCSTTTHSNVLLNKLLLSELADTAGNCPVLVIAITEAQLRPEPDTSLDLFSWRIDAPHPLGNDP